MRSLASRSQATEENLCLKALLQAQKEYEVALSYFDESTEPEAIDEAIFRMQAARKKYSLFLRKYKKKTGQASTLTGDCVS